MRGLGLGVHPNNLIAEKSEVLIGMAFRYGASGMLSSLGLGNNVGRSTQYEMATRRIGRNARRLANFTTEYERLRHIGELDPERANNANEYAEQYLRPPAALAAPAGRSYSAAAGGNPAAFTGAAPVYLSAASVAGGNNVVEENGNGNLSYSHEGGPIGGGGGGGGGGGSVASGGGGGVTPKYNGFLVSKAKDGKDSMGRPQKQYQILNTEVSVLLSNGGKQQQRIQRETYTRVEVEKGYKDMRTLTIAGDKKQNITDAYNAIVRLLQDHYKATIGRNRPYPRTQRNRKRKNQKTRKNRR